VVASLPCFPDFRVFCVFRGCPSSGFLSSGFLSSVAACLPRFLPRDSRGLTVAMANGSD
jgi:hypothetical protein